MSSQYERYADKLLGELDKRIRWISTMVRMIPENTDHIKVGSKWVTAHGDIAEITEIESDGTVWYHVVEDRYATPSRYPFLHMGCHYSILIKELV